MTVNPTKDGNITVWLDYVDKKEYSYRYNWWWHHHWAMQQQMMMMQQMSVEQSMRNNSGFGPRQYEAVPYVLKTEKHYFEIVLNSTNVVIDAPESETMYTSIDKNKYSKE
ncbi:hypothetical protein ES676_08280 [Bizionia saleffrena]|uniref:Uncharacterized protein n=1 Tax=Bizionia saleffrena TaxID=291189 RepID=A0A8H2LER6_9FLAO|nr:hypothetical protein [Bizionia saleffrena]TYB74170.1 hypothetical protein ES676_08280 [Bizionia saleffrena]